MADRPTLKKSELLRVKAAIDRLGATETARRLGIHSSVLMRLLAGQPVRLGSIELARSRLQSLADSAPERGAPCQ